MQIGLFTSGYQRNPLEHAFEDAKRFGYDYIELWGGRPHAFAPDLKNGDINTLRKLIHQNEMPVRVYTPEHNAYPYNFMIGSEQMRRDAIDYLKLGMEMGKEMEADFTLISPAHAGYLAAESEIRHRLIESIRELASFAEKIKHKLVIEALTPMESNVCTTANDLAMVFEQVESEYLAGMCDIVPPFIQHESILAYFDKLKHKMQHLHIIDSDGTSDTHMIPGEGVLPLKELLIELKHSGYKGTATIELVTAYINEPRLYARRAINNLKTVMDV